MGQVKLRKVGQINILVLAGLSVARSLGCLVGWFVGLSVARLFGQLVDCLIAWLLGWSVGRPFSQSVGHLVGWLVGRSS